jgi:toxin HigB-1
LSAEFCCVKSLWATARRKLDQLNFTHSLDDFRVPPGHQLEALKGDRQGQFSIRINQQYRICFVWMQDGAYEVEIVRVGIYIMLSLLKLIN